MSRLASLRDLPVAFVRGCGAASLRRDTAKRTFVKIEFVGILLSDYFSTFYQPDLEEQKKQLQIHFNLGCLFSPSDGRNVSAVFTRLLLYISCFFVGACVSFASGCLCVCVCRTGCNLPQLCLDGRS